MRSSEKKNKEYLHKPPWVLLLVIVSLAAILLVAYYFASSSSSPQAAPSSSPQAAPSSSPQAAPSSSPQAAPSKPVIDRFGISEIFPTHTGGLEWFSTWDNGHARTFTNAVDPNDDWFDASHGEGTYSTDGNGKLIATGDYVRMYVHDPAKTREWSENLEITTYFTRVNETHLVSYSGLQIFTRTNHGTNADETENLCDDRGYGAKVTVDGRWSFEKETRHNGDNGYADPGGVEPGYPLGSIMPKNTLIGVKYIIRNTSDGNVDLTLYRDLTGGSNGGDWKKIYEFVDNGKNLGVNYDPCKTGVDPAMKLIRSLTLTSSESKKPELTVYFRHEYGTMLYEKTSIREIYPGY